MRTVDISEAQVSLSRLVDVLERREEQEIVLSRNGRPVAKLVAVETPRRKLIGVAKGQFEVPDDIDTSNDDITRLFSG
jgi:antitoxin (DNA-binding transcriptional repressor) of toxin-antitoxin stability system